LNAQRSANANAATVVDIGDSATFFRQYRKALRWNQMMATIALALSRLYWLLDP